MALESSIPEPVLEKTVPPATPEPCAAPWLRIWETQSDFPFRSKLPP